ncbi:MAG: helix-turn-helix transcriptional regulator [Pirellulales bacterium]
MGHHPFQLLRDKMPPEAVARADARAKETLAEMLLAEIREAEGMTQTEVAEVLGIKQPTLSRIESQHDMQISTLKRIIEALGGKLEVIAHLPGGTIRIRQFEDAA